MGQEAGWTALDATDAGTIIHGQFPELAGLPVAWLGEGSDHLALAVGEELVFRFPKHAEAAQHLRPVSRLTAWLASRLPLALPVTRFTGTPAVRFHSAFSGEDRIVGHSGPTQPPPTDEHARLLGHFLRRLHGLPSGEAAALGLAPDDDPDLTIWSEAALDDLENAFEAGQVSMAERQRWRARLLHPPRAAQPPRRALHGDFAAEHVLLGARGRPTGVIDWSDALLGDPAQDLAGLLHWGGSRLLRAAEATYGPLDHGTWSRTRFYALCRALGDLSFGRTTGRDPYVAAGLRALGRLRGPD